MGYFSPMPLQLEHIRKGSKVRGILPDVTVTIKSVDPQGADMLEIVYQVPSGGAEILLLRRSDEVRLSLDDEPDGAGFSAKPDDFKLALEGRRMELAWAFDPMVAVHTSNVMPLPHQIDAVYGHMLNHHPLRFLLADDPGAGKTIMAGLLIQELMIRGDAERILVISPGSLSAQWRAELQTKFGLEFQVFDSSMREIPGNPLQRHNRLIIRLDQFSRHFGGQDEEDGELVQWLREVEWDLVVVDEAHKMSAHWEGDEVKRSKRYRLGSVASERARHFLLMTATPHSGKPDDYQLFLCLLDGDRFLGRTTDSMIPTRPQDFMRRMTKERMVTFDGTPLFPKRIAKTISYPLSPMENDLYQAVTSYVRNEMGRADRLSGGKRAIVGFALTSLQRRLASSPEAIYRSLQNRLGRLEKTLRDAIQEQRGGNIQTMWSQELPTSAPDLEEEDESKIENVEDTVTDMASAAATIHELEAEITVLKSLQDQAAKVVQSGEDRKWTELSSLIQNHDRLRKPDGSLRKLIVFTEFRSTLDYLVARIESLVGAGTVVQIHGGTPREARLLVQEQFRYNEQVRVLVATDAAGEGVNLQNAHLMVNYDLPWNPNRLEQRFGRVHRIGQKEVCYLWNLLAEGTREFDVYHQLLSKLDTEASDLQGDVFNILGDLCQEVSLQDLLVDAIRYAESPEAREHFQKRIADAFSLERTRDLQERRALASPGMSREKMFQLRVNWEKAQARKLLPGFVRTYFEQAFLSLDGKMHPRESGRWEIRSVNRMIRDRARNRVREQDRALDTVPVMEQYDRVCFDSSRIQPHENGRTLSTAALIHPGHPLFLAVNDLVLEQHRGALSKGSFLVDPTDQGGALRLIQVLEHEVCERKPDGTRGRSVSRRLQFVEIGSDGNVADAGPGPHLDMEAPSTEQVAWAKRQLEQGWNLVERLKAAEQYALTLAQDHFEEIQTAKRQEVEQVLAEVNERLTREINRLWRLHDRYDDRLREGTLPNAMLRDNMRRRAKELEARLDLRERELTLSKDLHFLPPVVVGTFAVIPAGALLNVSPESRAIDAAARSRVERLAMQAVMDAERAKGWVVEDVSAAKCGWDVTSRLLDEQGNIVDERHLEVKGRAKGQTTITVTRNETLYALNQKDRFHLVVVMVGPDDTVDGPFDVGNPFEKEPGWAEVSTNLDLAALLARSAKIEQASTGATYNN
jgi:superfamily II DNA or RNA helicase